jgi:hypothetical protein
MRMKYTKRGEVVQTEDVNEVDAAVVKSQAIITLGKLQAKKKADDWEIVNELDQHMMGSRD